MHQPVAHLGPLPNFDLFQSGSSRPSVDVYPDVLDRGKSIAHADNVDEEVECPLTCKKRKQSVMSPSFVQDRHPFFWH